MEERKHQNPSNISEIKELEEDNRYEKQKISKESSNVIPSHNKETSNIVNNNDKKDNLIEDIKDIVPTLEVKTVDERISVKNESANSNDVVQMIGNNRIDHSRELNDRECRFQDIQNVNISNTIPMEETEDPKPSKNFEIEEQENKNEDNKYEVLLDP